MLIQCHRNEKEVFCGALGKSTGAMAPVLTEYASSGTILCEDQERTNQKDPIK